MWNTFLAGGFFLPEDQLISCWLGINASSQIFRIVYLVPLCYFCVSRYMT